MRASDSHVTDDGRTGAVTRNPAIESGPAGPAHTEPVPGPGDLNKMQNRGFSGR